MQTKTYFANSVPAALEVARQELGADALLMNSRPSPADVRHLGRLEVTFAWEQRDAVKPLARAAVASSPQTSELDEIREQLFSLRVAMGQTQATNPAPDQTASPAGSEIVERLCSAGLSRETALIIDEAVGTNPRDRSGAALKELAVRIKTARFEEMMPGESRTLAFVGQPGRGKTASLVKIAVAMGLSKRIPVRIYSVGEHCTGGREQMARYAAILGVPWQSYDTVESLGLALAGDGWKGLALIDTPGLAIADRIEIRDFARFFASRPDIETHLVLRAEAGLAELKQTIARFETFSIKRLLFTGLDEVVSPGPLVDVLVQGKIPASFVGTGQALPDDLEQAAGGKLANAVWLAGNAIPHSEVTLPNVASPQPATPNSRYSAAAA
jgi:flagellar biosynthesis protein FlhF